MGTYYDLAIGLNSIRPPKTPFRGPATYRFVIFLHASKADGGTEVLGMIIRTGVTDMTQRLVYIGILSKGQDASIASSTVFMC